MGEVIVKTIKKTAISKGLLSLLAILLVITTATTGVFAYLFFGGKRAEGIKASCIEASNSFKTTYCLGEELDTETSTIDFYDKKGVKTEVAITNEMITDFSTNTVGTNEMKISYTHEGKTYQAKKEYTVIADLPEGSVFVCDDYFFVFGPLNANSTHREVYYASYSGIADYNISLNDYIVEFLKINESSFVTESTIRMIDDGKAGYYIKAIGNGPYSFILIDNITYNSESYGFSDNCFPPVHGDLKYLGNTNDFTYMNRLKYHHAGPLNVKYYTEQSLEVPENAYFEDDTFILRKYYETGTKEEYSLITDIYDAALFGTPPKVYFRVVNMDADLSEFECNATVWNTDYLGNNIYVIEETTTLEFSAKSSTDGLKDINIEFYYQTWGVDDGHTCYFGEPTSWLSSPGV